MDLVSYLREGLCLLRTLHVVFHKNFTKFVRNFYEIFAKFLRNFYKIFAKLLQNFYKIFVKFAKIS